MNKQSALSTLVRGLLWPCHAAAVVCVVVIALHAEVGDSDLLNALIAGAAAIGLAATSVNYLWYRHRPRSFTQRLVTWVLFALSFAIVAMATIVVLMIPALGVAGL